ncbi:hypothetical protein RJ639_008378 [Escallonia herrerae]|uniref:Uncharacterized protein n=1 Tax=Escallonia herrerae TaxID=1293975 RepID=A0AA88VV89_9ASTE|nr:hypothetical protein RJ639_008378 [Escallonia herrerae]
MSNNDVAPGAADQEEVEAAGEKGVPDFWLTALCYNVIVVDEGDDYEDIGGGKDGDEDGEPDDEETMMMTEDEVENKTSKKVLRIFAAL